MLSRRLLVVSALLLISNIGNGALAQQWPARPVQVVVPFGPGGVTDSMARISADLIAKDIGQPIVIDNRGGAGGVVGTQAALRAARDGYTLLFASSTQMVVSPLIHKVTYTPDDLVPISIVGRNIMGFVANPALGINTLEELIAHAKKYPGKLNYAIAGIGTNSHLTGELFKKTAGLDIVPVNYPNGPQSISAVISGDVQFYFGNLSDSMPFISSGKLKLLAVSSEKRRSDLPDTPTIAETLPGFTVAAWNGYFGLKGTPEPILKRLEGAVIKALQDPKVQTMLTNIGVDPVGSTSEEMAASLRSIAADARTAVEASGLTRK